MSESKVEKAFQLMNDGLGLLQNELAVPFLDAYLENGENINDNYEVRVVDNVPSPDISETIKEYYKKLDALQLSPEERRKVNQLVLLKGFQSEPVQPNHQLTPDTLGYLFVYLIQSLLESNNKENGSVIVTDLTVGTGNLLLTILLNMTLEGKSISGLGVDMDELLLGVAAVGSQWTGADLELFRQDSLRNLLLPPADVAIADLPVGFYPDDNQAEEYFMKAEEGHSYAHHLLMEQSMKYVKPSGYGVFLVPENFLESDQSDLLKKWFVEKVYLQGIIKLPATLFQSKQSRKSIVIMQNHGEQSQQTKEVLLAELPSLKELSLMKQFFTKFKQWQSENLKKD